MTDTSADQLQQSIKERQAHIDRLEQQDTHPAELAKLKDELAQLIRELHAWQRKHVGPIDSSQD